MGIIIGIVVILIVFSIIGVIIDSGDALTAIIIMMICGRIGCAIGSLLGGDSWAIFGAIL